MSPKPDVSRERIPQIIEAALAVFSQKGLHEASMSDIAQQAGISKATIYLYFQSKDDLIFSALRESLNEGIRELEEILDDKR